MFSTKVSGEFINSRISSPSIDHLGLLEIHIALPNVRMFRVTMVLLSAHPYFELDIEQDAMHES